MKKFISSLVLVITITLITLKVSTSNDDQSVVKFRTDSQQDAQVKYNESMLSNSLSNVIKNIDNKEKLNTNISNPPSEATSTSVLSNYSGEK